jgi:nitrite reductase/ring-hydroxylating ferredoxin subunit
MPHHDDRPCDGACGIPAGRRAFLRDAALAAAAALVALGGAPADALARPLGFVSALSARGRTRSYAIPAEDGATIDRDAQIILVRWEGAAYAFALSCPHQNTALRWLERDGRFQCPKHKSKYRPDGTFISGRATRGMDRYSIARQGDAIVVDLDALHEQDKDRAGWEAALLRL